MKHVIAILFYGETDTNRVEWLNAPTLTPVVSAEKGRDGLGSYTHERKVMSNLNNVIFRANKN